MNVDDWDKYGFYSSKNICRFSYTFAVNDPYSVPLFPTKEPWTILTYMDSWCMFAKYFYLYCIFCIYNDTVIGIISII